MINDINQNLLAFCVSGCKDFQYCSICSAPLTVINFSSSSCSLSSWSRNYFRVAVPRQDSHQCMMHLLISMLQTIFFIRFLYVKSQSIASTSNTTFWWALQTQTEWVIFEPARTHHLGLKAWNFEYLIFTFECFSLKAVYNYCKLQSLLQVFDYVLLYSH